MGGIKIELELKEEHLDIIAKKLFELNKVQPTVKSQIQIETTYTVEEVAKITKRSEGTIRNHIDKEILVANKPGKSYIITNTNLKNYINGKH